MTRNTSLMFLVAPLWLDALTAYLWHARWWLPSRSQVVCHKLSVRSIFHVLAYPKCIFYIRSINRNIVFDFQDIFLLYIFIENRRLVVNMFYDKHKMHCINFIWWRKTEWNGIKNMWYVIFGSQLKWSAIKKISDTFTISSC